MDEISQKASTRVKGNPLALSCLLGKIKDLIEEWKAKQTTKKSEPTWLCVYLSKKKKTLIMIIKLTKEEE